MRLLASPEQPRWSWDLFMALWDGGTALAPLPELQECGRPRQEPRGAGQPSHGQCPLPLDVTVPSEMSQLPDTCSHHQEHFPRLG